MAAYPKNATKHIGWHKKDGEWLDMATAFILVGYCDASLENFRALYKEAKKTFPDLKESDITCSKVKKSDRRKGCTIILFPVEGPKRDIKGWAETLLDFEY